METERWRDGDREEMERQGERSIDLGGEKIEGVVKNDVVKADPKQTHQNRDTQD